MRHIPVSSSNIFSIAYDESSRTLEVKFNSGSTYQYSNVPPSIYNALMSASSHGSYLASNIKGIYSYRQVG